MRRTKFRQLDRSSPSIPFVQMGVCPSSGWFDALSDDIVGLIIVQLITLTPKFDYLQVCEILKDAKSFILTCRRFHRITCSSAGKAALAEVLAMSSTHVLPRSMGEFTFTKQVRAELQSRNQLCLVRDGLQSMALHCAGKCCKNARRAFCKDAQRSKKKVQLGVMTERCSIVSPADACDAAFVSTSARDPQSPTRRHFNVIKRIEETDGRWSPTHEIRIDTDESRASPLLLKTNNDGTRAFLIRPKWEEQDDDHLSHSVSNLIYAGMDGQRVSKTLAAPTLLSTDCIINAQNGWWLDDDGVEKLAVLFSSSFIHSSGQCTTNDDRDDLYGFAVYNVGDDDETVLDVVHGPYQGRVMTSAHSRLGDEVALLLQFQLHRPRFGCIREVRVHALSATIPHIVETAATAPNGLCHHPFRASSCPSSVGFSNDGNMLVVLSSAHNVVVCEVFVRDATGYGPIGPPLDISHLFVPTDAFLANEHLESEHFLRLPYEVSFSPCNRFVAIIDRRSQFGIQTSEHGVVVLDLVMCRMRKGIKLLPLAPRICQQSIHAMSWSERGVVLQLRTGAVVMRSF